MSYRKGDWDNHSNLGPPGLEEGRDFEDDIHNMGGENMANSPSLLNRLDDVDLSRGSPVQKPFLGGLASSNFSMESLIDSNTPYGQEQEQTSIPMTPTLQSTNESQTSFGGQSGFAYGSRRYSVSSGTNSPILKSSAAYHSRTNSNNRPRPKSAIFFNDASNFAISEDGSPVQSPRLSASFTRTPVGINPRGQYLPPTSIAPPMSSRSGSPTRSTSPSRLGRGYRSKSPVRRSSSPVKSYQPFNFKPQEVMLHNNNSNSTLSVKPAQRKGHRYKHSSISMNLFQETSSIADVSSSPLVIPDSYPIPTFKESVAFTKPTQKFKFGWSLVHCFYSLIIFIVGSSFKLSSLSTLAHLAFYDSLGSIFIVLVDIMSNFEVWNKSSIIYPFGLGRLEVLVGFALSASLVMVGGDLVSHFVEEFIILVVVNDKSIEHDSGEHQSHHVHGEHGNEANWFVYELVLLVTIIVTSITSRFILSSEKINEIISSSGSQFNFVEAKSERLKQRRFSLTEEQDTSMLSKLKEIAYTFTKNPTHLLTLGYSFFLFIIPLIPSSISSQLTVDINEATSLVVSLLLCYIGWRLVKVLGGILLLSYPYSEDDYRYLKSNLVDEFLLLPSFRDKFSIENFFISKFNYELFVVGLKIQMKGASSDDESALRFEINRTIVRLLSDMNHKKKSKIEITIDIDR